MLEVFSRDLRGGCGATGTVHSSWQGANSYLCWSPKSGVALVGQGQMGRLCCPGAGDTEVLLVPSWQL